MERFETDKKILAHFANKGIWNARMGDLSAD